MNNTNQEIEMKIYKETEMKHPLYVAKLENGVVLFVYDGYALGDDGYIYRPAVKEINDDELEFLGWIKEKQKS